MRLPFGFLVLAVAILPGLPGPIVMATEPIPTRPALPTPADAGMQDPDRVQVEAFGAVGNWGRASESYGLLSQGVFFQ